MHFITRLLLLLLLLLFQKSNYSIFSVYFTVNVFNFLIFYGFDLFLTKKKHHEKKKKKIKCHHIVKKFVKRRRFNFLKVRLSDMPPLY